jgi:hypothetical protein
MGIIPSNPKHNRIRDGSGVRVVTVENRFDTALMFAKPSVPPLTPISLVNVMEPTLVVNVVMSVSWVPPVIRLTFGVTEVEVSDTVAKPVLLAPPAIIRMRL